MSNNDNQKNPSSLPDGLKSIADDEAITEINFSDFLVENSKSAPVYEGFHEDVEKTGQSIADELQNLYDSLVGSGHETIVPKPMSVLTASEAEPAKVALSDPQLPDDYENSSLDELWMNPEDYFDDDIPVVSLDGGDNASSAGDFGGEFAQDEFDTVDLSASDEDKAKSDIFNMIDLLKSDSDKETGFKDILSEIESNREIIPVANELSSASQLVTNPVAYEDEPTFAEDYEEQAFDDEELNWDDLEYSDAEPAVTEAVVDVSEDETVPVAEEEMSDFDRELAVLLGDIPPAPKAEEAEVPEAPAGFSVNIPDDGVDYERAARMGEKLYESAPMSTQPLLDDPDLMPEAEDDKKKSKKKNKKSKKDDSQPVEETKKGGAGEVIRKIVLSISIITIIASCGILVNTYFIEPYRFKAGADEIAEQMSQNENKHDETETVNSQLDTDYPEVDFPEGMLAKYAQLYAQNNDFSGWIKIDGFGINLPIAKGENNTYYLKRDIYRKYTNYGVPFFDYRMTQNNLRELPRNTMVYGHNMRHDDYIFGMLENYRTIEGFAQAPVIECDTIFGDHTWFVYGVYITNSTPEKDNGYFLPYNFIDISDSKFESYIEEVNKRRLYDTGVDINPTDRILTLQACVYDFDGAMIIVVAREKREGESISVDTSKAVYNPNPKYPQAWYDVNKKTNPYAEDSRW